MLESCATVEEAIAFYHKYREPQFSRAKILVADKSGASAIIGARDGKLQVDRANHSRGFGYGRKMLATMLQTNTPPKLEIGRTILQACEQKGQYATKYSSVFDLNKGEVALFATSSEEEVRLNLATELKRGGHYYDIPKLREQMAGAPMPPLSNMRSFLREYRPINDDHPELTERVSAVVKRCAAGKMRKTDFTPEFWNVLAPIKKEIQQDLAPFGEFKTASPVEPLEAKTAGKHRYKFEFKNAWVMQEFVINGDKVASLKTLGIEWKHPLPQ